MTAVEERGVHAHAQAAVDPLRRPDQLEAEAEVAGVLEVVARQVLDPLVRDLRERDRRVERQPGEDRHLRGGVAAGDVVGGIGLGVAQLLRLALLLLRFARGRYFKLLPHDDLIAPDCLARQVAVLRAYRMYRQRVGARFGARYDADAFASLGLDRRQAQLQQRDEAVAPRQQPGAGMGGEVHQEGAGAPGRGDEVAE